MLRIVTIGVAFFGSIAADGFVTAAGPHDATEIQSGATATAGVGGDVFTHRVYREA